MCRVCAGEKYENIIVYYSDSVVGRENFKTFSRPATLSHIHTTALWLMKILYYTIATALWVVKFECLKGGSRVPKGY